MSDRINTFAVGKALTDPNPGLQLTTIQRALISSSPITPSLRSSPYGPAEPLLKLAQTGKESGFLSPEKRGTSSKSRPNVSTSTMSMSFWLRSSLRSCPEHMLWNGTTLGTPNSAFGGARHTLCFSRPKSTVPETPKGMFLCYCELLPTQIQASNFYLLRRHRNCI